MLAIVSFFVAHWLISVFFQTFFLHRYGAHRMFTMSPRMEKVFHVLTWLAQGSSYLNPRAYAILHREHHAFSDTVRDPHSPHVYPDVFTMMGKTKERYQGLLIGTIRSEPRFEGGAPSWPALDRIGDSWITRIAFGVAYTAVYVKFAPHWAWFALLPVHYLMGPVHGAIVNWCGHKYGYRNFDDGDCSRNTLPFDFLTMGELFQNNHHKFGMAPNFAARAWEIDPSWPIIKALNWLGVIKLSDNIQVARWSPANKLAAHEITSEPQRV
ncbi:MAG: acyl-CoA desaturase [Deltaproteobacteria bacterium]|nr:acyl-CoA desaturase [Deltaproteobacteria bacterium]